MAQNSLAAEAYLHGYPLVEGVGEMIRNAPGPATVFSDPVSATKLAGPEGDRTPGLKHNQDGSLDIYIQKDSPGPERESNWLPALEGDSRPILRTYQPRPEALDGTYVLPPIRRVE